MKKKKVLIVFKYPHAWNAAGIDKFSNYYNTEFLYISNLKNKNFTEVVNYINNLIKSKNIDIVVFDVDYFKFINFFFIEKIDSKKKILLTGDDIGLHELHSVTASACDLVLTHCPLSVLKYREKGYDAHLFYCEFNKFIKNNDDIKKDIDVLFYGHLTPDRKNFLEYIEKEGISLKNVGHEDEIEGLPKEELFKLISRSKIVIQLSKTRTTSVLNYASESIFKYYYQFKGRMIVAGNLGTACVAEYAPGTELLFDKDELPCFFSKEECVKILKKLLGNKELLEKFTNKLNLKVNDLSDDFKNFESIYNAIEKLDNRKVKLNKIPYWYLRIAAKYILLRNIKLSSLIKTIFQFKIIFSIVKNSNFLVKFTIISESIVNSLWYSFMSTIKQKK
jgi:hypothetical protein